MQVGGQRGATNQKSWRCTRGTSRRARGDERRRRPCHTCNRACRCFSPASLSPPSTPSPVGAQDIEKRLSRPIAALDADLSLPADIAAHVAGGGGGSEVQYGQQRGGGVSKEVAERVAAVRPAVQGLARLEFAAQSSFYELKRKWAATAAHA